MLCEQSMYGTWSTECWLSWSVTRSTSEYHQLEWPTLLGTTSLCSQTIPCFVVSINGQQHLRFSAMCLYPKFMLHGLVELLHLSPVVRLAKLSGIQQGHFWWENTQSIGSSTVDSTHGLMLFCIGVSDIIKSLNVIRVITVLMFVSMFC